MNNKSIMLRLFLSFSMLIIAVGGMPVAAHQIDPPSTADVSIGDVTLTNTSTLRICLETEPSTLYLYGSTEYFKDLILSAVYDGPFDELSFEYQPVILERIPSLDNGDAVIQVVSVNEGDTVVNANGEVVDLYLGEMILPIGCYSSDCAITYSGGSVDMDMMEVNFYLLSGLTWSDGHALEASDSVYSFNLDAHPDTPTSKFVTDRTASYTTATGAIQNTWSGLPGFIPQDYSAYFWTPLPEHVWGIYTPGDLLNVEASSRKPLGWGPYVIDEWVAGSQITLHKNPNFHRASEGLPKFDNLKFIFTPDAMSSYIQGYCDIVPMTSIDLSSLNFFDNFGNLKVISALGTVWEHIDFGIQRIEYDDGYDPDSDRPDFFSDQRMRQAFALCMDRQEVVDSVLFGKSVVINTYVHPYHPLYNNQVNHYNFDVTAASVLLEEVGWMDDDNDPSTPRVAQGVAGIPDGTRLEVSYETTTASLRQQVVTVIQKSLKQCGIQANITLYLASEWFADGPEGKLFGRRFDLGEFAWLTGNEPPCDLYLSTQTPGPDNEDWNSVMDGETRNFGITGWGGQNDPGFVNGEYDAACNMALGSLPGLPGYIDGHKNAQMIFSEQLPVVPLFLRVKYGFAAPPITGLKSDPTENLLWNLEEIKIGESASIPQSGGTLDSPEEMTSYEFAPDTFSETVTVNHVALSPFDIPLFKPLLGAGHFFEVSAVDGDGKSVEPVKPYTLTIQYTDGELGMAIENTTALYYWDENQFQWVKEPTGILKPAENMIIANPDHFSIWALLAETKLNYLPFTVR